MHRVGVCTARRGPRVLALFGVGALVRRGARGGASPLLLPGEPSRGVGALASSAGGSARGGGLAAAGVEGARDGGSDASPGSCQSPCLGPLSRYARGARTACRAGSGGGVAQRIAPGGGRRRARIESIRVSLDPASVFARCGDGAAGDMGAATVRGGAPRRRVAWGACTRPLAGHRSGDGTPLLLAACDQGAFRSVCWKC